MNQPLVSKCAIHGGSGFNLKNYKPKELKAQAAINFIDRYYINLQTVTSLISN